MQYYHTAIITKYLPPTNTRCARVKASFIGGQHKPIVSAYAYEFNNIDNHERVAALLLSKYYGDEALDFSGYTCTDTGYIFI